MHPLFGFCCPAFFQFIFREILYRLYIMVGGKLQSADFLGVFRVEILSQLGCLMAFGREFEEFLFFRKSRYSISTITRYFISPYSEIVIQVLHLFATASVDG